MIEKAINWDGYTKAIVKAVYSDGTYLCDLEGEGKADTNISFEPFEFLPFDPLTDEEILSLSAVITDNSNSAIAD